MPDSHQIFKATYSGIPVYEMMCKGVAVMRRRSDSWLNATQILKVAGFDKPQRTRVLEREVQKGEHEKVQGGYGKYQGTWIPLERGLQLAKQYNCENLLRPIIDFQPAAKSPPLAPKHLVAAASGRPARRPAVDLAAAATRASRKGAPVEADDESDVDMLSIRGSEDGSMTPSPSEVSSSSRTPSPIRSSPDPEVYFNTTGGLASPSPRGPKHRAHRGPLLYDDHSDNDASAGVNGASDTRSYGDQILEYFISDSNQIPPILVNPPTDLDPNMAIDDEGHTALHWACAMGRVRIVKFLLSAGADIFKVNKSGQTALMRSVMFANNYDVRKFPELYELLHRSTLNIDNYNRTVFHHIVDVAMSKGKTHAARYYMETVLNRLSDYPRELADIINFQDEDGETALTMAARCRSKRLVKILIDHGADPKIANRDNKSTEDYILEDERFRSSPVIPSRALSMSFRNAQAAYPPPQAPPNYAFAPAHGDKPPLHHSSAGQKAATRSVNDMVSLLDSLSASFDQELRDKERDLNQAHALLGNIQAEILESQRAVSQLKLQSTGLREATDTLRDMEEELNVKMGKRYRLGWEKWVKDEEEREKVIRDMAGGNIAPVPGLSLYPADEPDLDSSLAAEKRNGKRKAAPEEDVTDLLALHANIQPDPDAVHLECDRLREDLGQHRKRRKDMFDEFVRFQAEAGTGGKMAEYRRLIAAGCGGISPSEVDAALAMLLESLESEEPSSSSVSWNSSQPRPMPVG
ncbi:transcription factor [Auriscalpium vulgare]|uniref:Transcription factor n=1 Tax=Auriscalpium vulgare TaxID=40419 RepID=A0ACB8RT57_9AGAM|nr:transcription factor [Auriscalpium vulgare]